MGYKSTKCYTEADLTTSELDSFDSALFSDDDSMFDTSKEGFMRSIAVSLAGIYSELRSIRVLIEDDAIRVESVNGNEDERGRDAAKG